MRTTFVNTPTPNENFYSYDLGKYGREGGREGGREISD